MESKKISVFQHSINYALVTGGCMIVFALLLYVLSVDPSSKLGYINFAILLAGIILGIKAYKEKYLGGFISYGKSFSLGLLIGVFSSVILAIYTFVFYKFFDPSMTAQIIAKAEEAMLEKNPNLTDEQVEMALSYVTRFTQPAWMAIWLIINNTLITLVMSLVASIFLKKQDDSFTEAFK